MNRIEVGSRVRARFPNRGRIGKVIRLDGSFYEVCWYHPNPNRTDTDHDTHSRDALEIVD